ncbi:MAG: flagellar basal body rod C-terminal domain-containing protein, partial [Sulfitobacter sp.]
VLLDGTAAQITFSAVNLVTPYMSQSAGSLSGLEINGYAVQTDSSFGPLRGGTLGANFAIRDELGVEAQRKLDAVARDLVERFQDPGVDPTLLPGDAGLFTDNGAAFAPIDELGLSQRLQLNASVDPMNGGESWRLRDGIGAATAGEVGDATILQSLADALDQTRVPASGGFGTGAFSAINLVASMTSAVGGNRHSADQTLSFAAARYNELAQLQLADGVDTDSELQRLLVVEQVYAANAKVIQAVDEMMQTIMRL